MKNNRGTPQKIKGIQDRKNERHKIFSNGTVIGNRTFHSTDGLRYITEHWLICPKSEHIRRSDRPHLSLPSCIQSKSEGLVTITSEYNWEIYIEFGHYEDGFSVSDGAILAEVFFGTEKRHKTPYLTTRLRKFKTDLSDVYDEVSNLYWIKGEESTNPDRILYLHRLVYTWLTKESLVGFEIHHINENGVDNDINNMIPLSPPIHALLHNGKTLDDLINDLQEPSTISLNISPIHNNESPPVTCIRPSTEHQNSEEEIPPRPRLLFGSEMEFDTMTWNFLCDTYSETQIETQSLYEYWPNTA